MCARHQSTLWRGPCPASGFFSVEAAAFAAYARCCCLGLNTGLSQCLLSGRFHMHVVFVCLLCKESPAQLSSSCSWYWDMLNRHYNWRGNMQACRKTQTSITDAVCCPLALQIPESHTASQLPAQPLLWSSELLTGLRGSVNSAHSPLNPLTWLVIEGTLPVSPQNLLPHRQNVPGPVGPMEAISDRSLPDLTV